MRINFIALLLACGMTAGTCLAGTLEASAPAQGSGTDTGTAQVGWAESFDSSSTLVFGSEVDTSSPVEEAADNVTGIGASVDVMKLDRLRGGESTVENNVLLDGTVEGNTADHVVSGSNAISDGAFSNASGINTVIQNTGSNVLIQNGMVVNVQFVAPVVP